jgi:UDP-N-acetylglucosamine 2-epimerase (non-hydrolysing)
MTVAHDGADDRRAGSAGVAIVLGTRPEIVKFAPIVRECEARGVPVTIVHTGQHYSPELDRVFFEDLGVPTPDHNLAVGSGSHGAQTAAMLAGVEAVLVDARPAVVLVQGDTNSTLAGALAAAKLGVPVGHVEAGLRSFDRAMPEEVNRVVVDHLATHLFAPTEETAALLRAEGIVSDAITVTGNTVVDAVMASADRAATDTTVLADLGLEPGAFYLLTAHRAENVDDPDRFRALLEGVGRVVAATGREAIYPVHPRAAARLADHGIALPPGVRAVDPLPFLEFVRLEATAALAFTDSGGVQEEACILGTPCVTLRYTTERPETVHVGANVLAGLDPDDVVEAAAVAARPRTWTNPFGDGRAAARILDVLAPALAATGPEADTDAAVDGPEAA